MKASIKYLLTAILLLGVGALFYNKVYIPKITFETLSPTRGNLNVTVQGIGNVGSKESYAITAQTGGKIIALHTDIGQWVKKGDILVEMDGVDLPAQLAITKANLNKANADTNAAMSDLMNQKAQKKLLQITYDRYAKLQKQKFASQSEFDKAKADLESIDAAIRASKAHINAAKATAVVASKNIDALKVKMDRLKIYAPIDGYVTAKNAQVAQNVLPTTAIFTIVDSNTLWVVAKIDERVSSKVKLAQSVKIHLRSQEEKVYKGVVARIDPVSDSVTLEREIDIAFKEIPQPFYINEQAQVQITVAQYKDIVKIPAKLLVQNGGKLGVWIAKDAHAHFVECEIIAKNSQELGVKNLPLTAKIIIPNSHKKPLKEGMSIHL